MKQLQALVWMAALAAGLSPACLWAQDLRITGGPAPGSVVQRGEDGRGNFRLSGTAPKANRKYIEARVLANGAPLAGFDWKALDRVNNGKFTGEIKGVPHGGPYDIEVRVAAGAPELIKGVYIGDLWILAGQSNMEGYGNLDAVEEPEERVRSFDMTDKWVLATEPLHRLVDAADAVHWPLKGEGTAAKRTKMSGAELGDWILNRKKGAGLGLTFAKEISRQTGIPIGLIPCAHGGTSMDEWSPEKRDAAGDSLYGATFRRFQAAGSAVKGILWYQGESDANPTAAPKYAEKMEGLIAAFRKDFNQPNLPFYLVQIARHTSTTNTNEWNLVQDVQRQLESKVPGVVMVPAVDLDMDDGIHIGVADLKRLGKRLANQVLHDFFADLKGFSKFKRGPRPAKIVRQGNGIKVTFDQVNGKLVHVGKVNGFSIHAANGAYLPLLYRQLIDPTDGNSVLLLLSGQLPAGATLRYAYGKEPYVTLNDELDMGVPAFGPLPIE